MKRISNKTRQQLEKIIQDATVDCYDESEALSGWETTLEENIRVPQDCTTNHHQATLLKFTGSANSINALVLVDGKKLIVPIETIKLLDSKQDLFIQAYKQAMT